MIYQVIYNKYNINYSSFKLQAFSSCQVLCFSLPAPRYRCTDVPMYNRRRLCDTALSYHPRAARHIKITPPFFFLFYSAHYHLTFNLQMQPNFGPTLPSTQLPPTIHHLPLSAKPLPQTRSDPFFLSSSLPLFHSGSLPSDRAKRTQLRTHFLTTS